MAVPWRMKSNCPPGSLMYKIVHSLVDVSTATLCPVGCQTCHTSHLSFCHLQSNKNCYRSCFFPCTIPKWNSLPLTLCSTVSVQVFKYGLSQVDITEILNSSHYLKCHLQPPLNFTTHIGDRLYSINLDLDLDLHLTLHALNTLNTDNMFDGYLKKKWCEMHACAKGCNALVPRLPKDPYLICNQLKKLAEKFCKHDQLMV